MSVNGKLQLTLIEAELTHDTELIGKMDPFVTFQFGDSKVKSSKINKKGGLKPKWSDQVFEFQIEDRTIHNTIKYEVKDKDLCKSDLIGEGELNIVEITHKGGGINSWFPIHFQGEKAGMIHYSTEWLPAEPTVEEVKEAHSLLAKKKIHTFTDYAHSGELKILLESVDLQCEQ